MKEQPVESFGLHIRFLPITHHSFFCILNNFANINSKLFVGNVSLVQGLVMIHRFVDGRYDLRQGPETKNSVAKL